MADTADKHILYQESVQCVEAEIDFIDETFEKLSGRKAITLREDFCGTMNTSCEWIRRRDKNIAYSIDLDENVLDWGRKNNIASLDPEQQLRMRPVNANVLAAEVEPVDCILAMNFSYWIFKQRTTLKQYFNKLYDDLVDDGILFLDCFGGYEAFQELEESTKHKGFTYVWDQASYNPINGDCTCHIHFKFKDGSKIKQAFSYHWRLWTLPELLDVLAECRFRPTVYWEGTDEDGEGNGVFEPTMTGEADAGWIAYIVCEKQPV
ncbi:MAG: hypothetical protein MI673_10625 [Thiotrichales bacterium]|nr:hypothetical protein [Thiotrichales bacterium]